jgi:hypothetical protein
MAIQLRQEKGAELVLCLDPYAAGQKAVAP